MGKILKMMGRKENNSNGGEATPTKKKSKLALLIEKKFGQMPDAAVYDNYAMLPIPRSSIENSSIAVKWLNDLIVDLDDDETDSELIEALKGTYMVFRDCSLLAKHYLGFMDANNPRRRENDIGLKFTINPKDENQVLMEVGYLPKLKDGK